MIINRIGAEFEYEGVTYVIGASIVGTPESEYEGLYGSITEIRDGEDKDTENETPDIYCSFEVPVIPYDVEELEERFSELYQNPKTIDDIVLDLVIMAPEMICPLDDLKECRHHPMVFILAEDWAVEGEHGSSSEVYENALHGCQQSEKDKLYIEIYIHMQNNRLTVVCENICSD